MSTGMFWQTASTSSAATERLGRLLGSRLKGGEVIELRSDLGGGKTTFVRGLAKGAGSKAIVTSPTFTLCRIYQARNFEIHHYDFYRLKDPGILAAQLAESISDKHTVSIIEWADIVKNVLPKDRISLEFKPTAASPDERQINVLYPPAQRPLIIQIETDWQQVRP